MDEQAQSWIEELRLSAHPEGGYYRETYRSASRRLTNLIVRGIGSTPPERFRELLDRWSARGPAFVRTWAGIGLGLGLFFAYAVFPYHRAA